MWLGAVHRNHCNARRVCGEGRHPGRSGQHPAESAPLVRLGTTMGGHRPLTTLLRTGTHRVKYQDLAEGLPKPIEHEQSPMIKDAYYAALHMILRQYP